MEGGSAGRFCRGVGLSEKGSVNKQESGKEHSMQEKIGRSNVQGMQREVWGGMNRIHALKGNGTQPGASRTLVTGADPMLWLHGSHGRLLNNG